MTTVQFGGLVSGIDSNSIIDKLVALEKSPEKAMTKAQTDAQTRSSVLDNLVSRLTSLSTAAAGINTPTDLRSMTGSSSDSSRFTVTASSAANPGSYAVSVQQLASAQTSQSTTFLSDSGGIAGAGTLTLTVGTGNPVNVTYDGADSLSSIATKINNSGGAFSASVLNDGTSVRLLVQARSSGTAGAVTFADTGGLGMNELNAAKDAKLTLNTIPVTRSSNVISDLLPGVTMTLRSETPTGSPDTTLNVGVDRSGVHTKVQTLIDAFNSVAGTLNSQLAYTGIKKGPDTLFGDPGAQALQRQLGSLITKSFGNASGSTSAATLGITFGATGMLNVDTTKLDAALDADPDALNKLILGTGKDGLAQALVDMTATYTEPTNGVFTSQKTGLQSRIKSYDAQITAIENRATLFETTLRAQFTAMENTISSYQTQQNFLTALSAQSSSNK